MGLANGLGLDAEGVSFASLGAERNILDYKVVLSTVLHKNHILQAWNEAMNGNWEQKQIAKSDLLRRLLKKSF